MQITINGQEIRLNRKEVKMAKRIAAEQIEICRNQIGHEKNPSLYITYLIMLNLLSGEALEVMDMEAVAKALEIKSRFNG